MRSEVIFSLHSAPPVLQRQAHLTFSSGALGARIDATEMRVLRTCRSGQP